MQNTAKKVAVGTGLLGLAVAGLAGAYFLYGKDGAKNRKKVKAWALKAKAEVLEKIEKTKEMSEENYNSIIDTVSEKYAKVKDITPEDVAVFSKDLKKHWKDIKKELMPKDGKKPAKKAAQKAA